MAEQTFRSPGFFDQEIDLSQTQKEPAGVPAGIAGTSERGPAFVPIKVGSFSDFTVQFGSLDPKKFGPYAVQKFLENRSAVTYVRVLGAGANDSAADIETTRVQGTVKNAGFRLRPKALTDDGRHSGAVQFLVARHFVSSSSDVGYPVMTDNDSLDTTSKNTVNLTRAMILVPSGTRIMLLEPTGTFGHTLGDESRLEFNGTMAYKFKLVISSSTPGFGKTDGLTGLKILTASLNPTSNDYISKILNTDPERFIDEEHLLYADFAVEDEIATVAMGSGSIAILSGSSATSAGSGDTSLTMRDMFGRFDTRYTTPKTPYVISQPFGNAEYDLFYFLAKDDGEFANTKYKISISDIKASDSTTSPYGSFTVVVRDFYDTDTNIKILERFPLCNMNPNSSNYVAKLIGDRMAYYNFDATQDEDRKLVVTGKYPSRSKFIRVKMGDLADRGNVPAKSLPFGFRGVEVLKTTSTLTDTSGTLPGLGNLLAQNRLTGQISTFVQLTGSIVPPIPLRFKVTRGAVETSPAYAGQPGQTEIADSRLYWGVKFERAPRTGSFSNSIYNTNASSEHNPLISAYTQFVGIKLLDALVTGSGADAFCNNKFTLARVALSAVTTASLTSSVDQHMLEAAYIRNGVVNPTTYTVTDGTLAGRLTMATLVNQTSSISFNRFVDYNKFSMFMYGGFNGLNSLDKFSTRMNDRSVASDTGGGSNASYVSPGLVDGSGNATNVGGIGKYSNNVNSYRTAARLLTDPMVSDINILAIPGIRDALVTDYTADLNRSYGLSIYIQDAAEYDENSARVYDDSTVKPDVDKTIEQFKTRGLDNSYSAAYFPNVIIDDDVNNRRVEVPPSIAVLAAYGFNDRVGYPWFAPAGFNRASLDFVKGVDVRLTSGDRNNLYDAKINPIATFPNGGFVIMGQKTLQQSKSSLDRVNVRRMLLEIKRQIISVANSFVFEQNNKSTRDRFIKLVTPKLNFVQSQAGIEKSRIVMDESNNTPQDAEANRLNGRIVIVPTRSIEFIAMDFIVGSHGVVFV